MFKKIILSIVVVSFLVSCSKEGDDSLRVSENVVQPEVSVGSTLNYLSQFGVLSDFTQENPPTHPGSGATVMKHLAIDLYQASGFDYAECYVFDNETDRLAFANAVRLTEKKSEGSLPGGQTYLICDQSGKDCRNVTSQNGVRWIVLAAI